MPTAGITGKLGLVLLNELKLPPGLIRKDWASAGAGASREAASKADPMVVLRLESAVIAKLLAMSVP